MKLRITVDGFQNDFDTARVQEFEAVFQQSGKLEIKVLDLRGKKLHFNIIGDLKNAGQSVDSISVTPTAETGSGKVAIADGDQTFTVDVTIGEIKGDFNF